MVMKFRDIIIIKDGERIKLKSLINDDSFELNKKGFSELKKLLALNSKTEIVSRKHQFLYLQFKDYLREGNFFIKEQKSNFTSIGIEVTTNCNLNCKHCYLGNNRNVNLSNKTFKTIIDSALNIGAYSINITGGEPFLDESLFDKIKYARDRNLKLTINTNGTLLDRSKVQKLKDFKIAKLTLTLNGDKKEHEYICGKRTYKKTINTLKLLNGANISFSLNHMIYPKNFNNLKKFFESNVKYTPDSINVVPIMNMGNAKGHPKLQLSDRRNKWVYKNFLTKTCNEIPKEGLNCGAGKKGVFIKADGNVLPCSEWHNYFIGNIKRNSLENILSKPNNRLKALIGFNSAKIVNCPNCDKFQTCGGGCRARAYNQGNLYGVDKILCIYEK